VSKRSLLVVFLVAGVAAAVWLSTAVATAPGTNGRIAFRRYLDTAHTHGAVFIIAPDGSGLTQVTHPPAKTIDDQPDVSPDGRQIVFTRCPPTDVCRVMIVNADGSGLRSVTKPCGKALPADRIPAGCEDGANAYFTPDGAHVTYTRSTGRLRVFKKLDTDAIQHSAVTSIATDGTGRRELFRLPAYSGDANFPILSPDGRTILFELTTSPVGHPANGHGVYAVGVDGKGLRRITPRKLRAGDGPDWSPDGRRIVFRSNEDVGDFLKSQIYTMNADGTGLLQLTHWPKGTRLFSSAYSPDGTRITFGMAPKGKLPDVYTMALDGSDVQQVTRTPDWDSAPDWGGTP
jgi:Tol biopolymer transport system component